MPTGAYVRTDAHREILRRAALRTPLEVRQARGKTAALVGVTKMSLERRREIGRLGGLALPPEERHKRGVRGAELMRAAVPPEQRREWSRRGGRRGSARTRELEEIEAARLRAQGWAVFKPHQCCDRIAISSTGQVFFYEFKSARDDLRDEQRRLRDLVPNLYRVVRYGE